jgi:hypothetical protein
VFSEPVQQVTSKTLRLLGPGGKRISATVKFKAGAKSAVLVPKASLLRAGLYRVGAVTGITDLALNPLKPATSSTFRVR